MGVDEREHTDVHYRSLNGEGNFNWRLIFPFGYIPAENELVVSKKEHFWSLDTTEKRFPAVLCLQVWLIREIVVFRIVDISSTSTF